MNAETLALILEELDQVTDVCVVAMVNLNGFRYFELRMEQQDPEGTKKSRYMGSVNFPLYTVKELGITKTMNGSKKLGAWLATEEGRKYVVDSEKDRYQRRYRREEEARQKYLARKQQELGGSV